jgi:Protein of unknown function (DUF3987)
MKPGRIEEIGDNGQVQVLYDAHREPEDVSSTVPWPEPLKEQAFHGVIGELAQTIDPHTEADQAAIVIQSLVAFGNMVGRGAFFRVEADHHFGNLFAVIVGPTAKGRKGTSWGHIRRVNELVDQEWVQTRILSGLSSGEGVIWSVRDPIEKQEQIREHRRVVDYQTIVDDPGVSDKRALLIEAEFSAPLKVMEREGNTLSAVLRDAWDTGTLRTLTKNSPARATGAYISIIGHVTRDELRRNLTSTETANGFANRILWSCARRSKVLPEGGHIEDVNLSPIIERLKQARDFAKFAGELRRDADARRMWYAVYEQLSEGKPGLLGSVTGRAEAQVVRLSLLYALLDSSPIIRAEHLEAALAVWDYCEASAKYVFGDALGDPISDSILTALKTTPSGLTRTEIAGLFGRHKSAGEIDGSLAAIEAMGRAGRQTERTSGRPVERWKIVNHHA